MTSQVHRDSICTIIRSMNMMPCFSNALLQLPFSLRLLTRYGSIVDFARSCSKLGHLLLRILDRVGNSIPQCLVRFETNLPHRSLGFQGQVGCRWLFKNRLSESNPLGCAGRSIRLRWLFPLHRLFFFDWCLHLISTVGVQGARFFAISAAVAPIFLLF